MKANRILDAMLRRPPFIPQNPPRDAVLILEHAADYVFYCGNTWDDDADMDACRILREARERVRKEKG